MFKKINVPYKLSISNEVNYKEVVLLHLTKKGIYVLLTSFFIGVFILFSLLIFFTPLKYYLPGNHSDISRSKVIHLQKLSDSLVDLNTRREQFIYNLIKVSNGSWNKITDTTTLSKQEISKAIAQNLGKIDRAGHYEYLKYQKKDTSKKDGIPGLNADVNSTELEALENALKNVLIKDSTSK